MLSCAFEFFFFLLMFSHFANFKCNFIFKHKIFDGFTLVLPQKLLVKNTFNLQYVNLNLSTTEGCVLMLKATKTSSQLGVFFLIGNAPLQAVP